ncbi:MAG: hypothetical protein ACXWW7_14870 [Nocardioides sp.]
MIASSLWGRGRENGKDSHSLFAWLKKQQKGSLGGRINWNSPSSSSTATAG